MPGLITAIGDMATEYAPYAFGVAGAVLVLVGAFALSKWVVKRVRAAIK